jgi:hypothetical protein
MSRVSGAVRILQGSGTQEEAAVGNEKWIVAFWVVVERARSTREVG